MCSSSRMGTLDPEGCLQLADKGVKEIQKDRIGCLNFHAQRVLDQRTEDNRQLAVRLTRRIDPLTRFDRLLRGVDERQGDRP